MSEPSDLPKQPCEDGPIALDPWIAHEIGDDGPAALRRWIAREIASQRGVRSETIGAVVREALPAVRDRGLTLIRRATRALTRRAMPMPR